MRLDGIHHITCITADAPRNVDFYVRVLGLRMIKKTVNFDHPEVYHLYYADEEGTPGAVMTFFEFPGVPPGRLGAGEIHTISWRVPDASSFDFWEARLETEGAACERVESGLRFRDPDGLGLELVPAHGSDPPLAAEAPDVPQEHALLGFDGVRTYSRDPAQSEKLLVDALGFDPHGDEYRIKGESRHAHYGYDAAPEEPAMQGAGSVHHIAWACAPSDQEEWRRRALEAGASVTPIIDRQYFRSIYFREPSGVLFEIATLGPGFTIDEPLERLGEGLTLPPQHEHLRERLEQSLTPLENPRLAARRS